MGGINYSQVYREKEPTFEQPFCLKKRHQWQYLTGAVIYDIVCTK